MRNLYHSTCDNWKIFRQSKSGERFQKLYRCRKSRDRHGFCVKKVVTWVVGIVLIIVGLAIGWLPGPGGFVGIIGLALIARQSLWIARLLDYCERKGIQFYRFLKNRFAKSRSSNGA